MLILLITCGIATGTTTKHNGLTVAELLDSALSQNQQVLSADAQSQRYNTRIALIDKLTEPLTAFYYLDFPVSNISQGVSERINQAQAGPAKKVQVRSVRGKILTGKDMIENQALWYDYRAADLRLQIARQVRENFYRLYFLDQIITVTRQSNDTLQNLLQAADTQYAVGKIRQKDVLSLQEQRYQLQARLLEQQEQRVTLATRLNYLAGRSISAELIPYIEGGLEYEDLVEPKYNEFNLISGLFNNRPLMKGYQALGGRFRAMRSMVKMYFNRDVQDEAYYEADGGLRAVKAEGADFYNQVSADIQIATSNLKTNRELARLYGRVLVPKARQLFQTSLADFKVGRSDYKEPLESLLNLYRYQEKYYQTLTDYQVDLARLESLSGVAINEDGY
ncbi:TolC family protein [Malonomonas rubra]|uniref:TolC family protein n=1 Tax=Malonomonas rubra TaxID=57040 RepID=UPI0026ED6E3E|nr:TolC family protein [Malonomonas rubra]